jgi:hypothetical protein
VPGHRDQRQTTAEMVEPSLQLQAIHARHPDIEEYAAGRQSRRSLQKVERRFVRDGLEAGALQKPLERPANRCVVIDDMNGAFHASPVKNPRTPEKAW